MSVDAASLRARLAAAVGDSLQIGDLLGAGGSAAVFSARDPFLERDVAIKVLDPALAVSDDAEDAFLREARIVAGVEHPHIVPLYAAESRDGLLYLVMRLLPGRSLADRLNEEHALPAADAARMATEVAEALALAHERGVVHRDIKPDNILLDAAGHAIVTDFGISLITNRPSAEATAGVTSGTPRYMSPEQALGEHVDGRSDVYSLGIMLYEMLAGHLPFEARSTQELIAMHIAAAPPKLSSVMPATPAPLVELVDRMLAKDPAARPTSAEVAKALLAAQTPDALLAPAEVQRRRRRKRFRYAAIVGGTAAVVLVGAAWLVIRGVTGLTGAMNAGDPPVLDAPRGSIPDSIVGIVAASGVVQAGEVVKYAFIPAGRTSADLLVVTDSALLRRWPSGWRRYDLRDMSLNFNLNKPGFGKPSVGSVILEPKSARPETLYTGLGGLELTRIGTSIRAATRAAPTAR